MTLLEEAASLKGKVTQLEQMQKLGGSADHFEKRAKDLEVPARELSELGRSASLLFGNAVLAPQIALLGLGQWAAQVASLKDRYAQDPVTILDPFPNEDVRARLLTPLKQLPVKVREVLSAAWASWASSQLPAVNDEILTVLGTIQALRGAVEKLQVLKRQLSSASAKLPQSQADFDLVVKVIRTIEREWASLAGAGIPKEVIRFLRAAGQTGGAPYVMLTPSVMAWLEEHQLAQSLKVRIG